MSLYSSIYINISGQNDEAISDYISNSSDNYHPCLPIPYYYQYKQWYFQSRDSAASGIYFDHLHIEDYE